MPFPKEISRRTLVKSSIFGFLAVQLTNVSFARQIITTGPETFKREANEKYPAISDDLVSELVGASHFDYDLVRKIVNKRPELARATWDWGFGDFESALGAASHVARKDIATYLMMKGARANIFTFAMLGAYEVVKEMIEFFPGIQKTSGPHGISLLQHAENGLRNETGNKRNAEKLMDFLKKLGDADSPRYLSMDEDEKSKYLGDYMYGKGEKDGFSIQLNMRKLLSLGKLGQFGGALYRLGENSFTYNGAPSVKISFEEEDGKILSLTIEEPDLVLKAVKVNG
jgi:hypothetical protein